MGIPLISGRAFENHDDARGMPVAVVDRTFVQRYFPGEEPIGRRIQMTNERMQRQIVGVVGAVRQTRLEDAADPHVYIPHAQNPSPVMTFVVRTAGDPAALAAPVRERLRTVDPSRPVYNVTHCWRISSPAQSHRGDSTRCWSTLFALLAGVLTVVGMYGLMAGWVAESRKEFGVRLALGAERRDVLGLVVRRALLITAVGIATGLPVALASTQDRADDAVRDRRAGPADRCRLLCRPACGRARWGLPSSPSRNGSESRGLTARRLLSRGSAARTAAERAGSGYFAAAGCFFAFAAALRLSDVCAPNRLVKRSTRPSVSTSFWRPVKNGWQLLQISRCNSGLVDRVFHVAPHAQRASISWYFG